MQDLLQLMYQDGHLSSTELAALQRASRQLKENPIKILRSLNIVTPGEIRELLQRYYGFSAATDKLIEELDDSLRTLLPADIALHYCALPIAEENGEVYVLMEDPTDKGTISQLEFLTDKKVVPVIATAQQLSSGLCWLYGVEPGRLKLSGVLEASRGAVGIASLSASKTSHFVDDSRPLLDDDVYINLKSASKKTKRNERIEALRPQVETAPPRVDVNDSAHSSDVPQPSAIPQNPVVHSAPESVVTEAPPQTQEVKLVDTTPPAPPVLRTLEPDFVAAINVLGLSLTIAQSKSEAVQMVNTRLKDFMFTLNLLENNMALIVWSGKSHQIPLTDVDSRNDVPAQFKTLLKKISQCPTE